METALLIPTKDMPPVKDEMLEETNCLEIINITEKSPTKNSALVDVRACNKPVAKVKISKINNCSFSYINILFL